MSSQTRLNHRVMTEKEAHSLMSDNSNDVSKLIKKIDKQFPKDY